MDNNVKKWKYDAFISYRHCELDKFVAENLHRQLESFRLPKSIAKKRPGQRNKIERVFRDKEELPLTSNLNDPIMDALHNSEWLIVICSPRLRESMWCKKEIETFVALRGREKVLAVLIEGEPGESFPDELLFKTEKIVRPDGIVEEIKIPVEPLAADVRGKSKKEVLKAMKTETLRLCAPIFQLDFDDLRQRHKEQRMKRILTASLIGGATCLAFGIYSTATALRISSQNKQIAAQSEEILAQSEEIRLQNEELALKQALALAELSEQYLEAGNRSAAIEAAKEALTESDGIELPYTPEAQYILTEAVRAYDIGLVDRAEIQVELAGRIEDIKQSPDMDTLAILDDTDSITLFDLSKKEIVTVIGSGQYDLFGSYGFTFLGDDRFAYINTENTVCIYSLTDKEIVKEIPMQQASGLTANSNGNYLAVEQWDDTSIIFDGNTYRELWQTPDYDSYFFVDGPYISDDGIFACSYSEEGVEGQDKYTLYFIDLNTMEEISSCYLGERRVRDLVFRDGVAYVAMGWYSEDYSETNAYATAIDIQTGEVIWETSEEGYYVDGIAAPYNEGATEVLLTTSQGFWFLDINTGEEDLFQVLESEVVEVNTYLDNNNYLLFCEDGTMWAASGESMMVFDMSYRFECKSMNNAYIFNSQDGIAVAERNDNMITVYTSVQGPKVVSIDEEVEYNGEENDMLAREAQEIALSYGLENASYVLSLYYSADERYCFVTYWDYAFVIYDTQERKVLNSMEYAYPTEWYIGTDEDGNTYLGGYYGVYIMNEDMKPVTWISDARHVDLDTRKVYLSWNGNYYEAPLYSVEELIQIAEDYGEN